MKRFLTLLLALAVFVSTLGFGTAFAADDELVEIARGKAVGGTGIGGAWTGLSSGPSVVDGNETTGGGFYANYGTTGCMYIDLGMEYKIDHIEILAYNDVSYKRAGDFNIIAAKELPDTVAFDENNDMGEAKVAYVEVDESATTIDVGYKSFDMPDNGEKYRFISFEKFADDSAGLILKEVKVFVKASELPKTVNVAGGKVTGGTGIGGAWTGLVGESSNIVDGKDDTESGFYANYGTTGYMYVDLGAEYKIDHIEIMAYNKSYADRAGDFDIVVTNKLPNEVPAAQNPNKTLVTHVGVDNNATSEAVGYKSFGLSDEIKNNAYRYVSLEKLTNNGYGLLVQEIKVYVLEENLPLNFSNAELMVDGEMVTIAADLTNGEYEEMALLMKAYDKNGMVQRVATETIGLPTFVVNEPFTAEIDVRGIAEDDLTVDIMAVDSLENMKPVFYVENALADERKMLDFESGSGSVELFAGQKGMNSQISGSALGNMVFATLLYPSGEIAYFGYDETADGEFEFDVVMPEKADSGEYTAIIGVIGKDIPTHERTKVFEFVSLVEDFENVTAQSFLETAEKYSESYPELYALLEEKADTIGESFMLAKAVFESGKANEKINALSNSVNIKTAMEAALLIDATINSEDFEDEIDDYKDTMPLIFNENFANTDKFVKYLNKVKASMDLDDAQSIIKAYEKSIALAILSGGTRADIATVIENYADAMEVDLEEIEDAGVTINEVAKKISVSDASMERFLKNGMGADVESAIDDVLADKKKNNSSSGGGGGGGGRGSSTIYPPPSVPLDVTQSSTGKIETAVEEADVFTDLAGFEWAKEAIGLLSEKEILGGVGGGKFAPSANLTREQAAKLIVLAFDLESTMKTNKFSDCDIEQWYYPYVTAASANGIVKGMTRTEFGVGSYVTRQDMAVMLDRALMLKGLASGSTAHGLTDMDSVDDYAKDSVTTLAAMGIINGMEDGSFCPHNQITRAEAAVMLARIIDLF